MEYKYTSQQRYSQKIRDKGNNIITDRLESGFEGERRERREKE
jgi:hypothetical protein